MGIQILLFLLILIIPVGASIYVSTTYQKYKKIKVKKDVTGYDVAREILDKNGLNNINIVEVQGQMSDHYDPGKKVVRLSKEVYKGSTIAACAIAAHEVGHAIQDKNKYVFMNIRQIIFPVVNLANYAAYIFLIISFILSSANLINLAIICMLFGVVFQLVTLPVEFNASKRAKKQLVAVGGFTQNELGGISTMLSAAAFTYVAGLVASILEILRLILIFRNE